MRTRLFGVSYLPRVDDVDVDEPTHLPARVVPERFDASDRECWRDGDADRDGASARRFLEGLYTRSDGGSAWSLEVRIRSWPTVVTTTAWLPVERLSVYGVVSLRSDRLSRELIRAERESDSPESRFLWRHTEAGGVGDLPLPDT